MLEAGNTATGKEFVDLTGQLPLPDVERWIGESILAPDDNGGIRAGTLWASAYLDAVEEMERGLASPSPEYRRRYALPLGLQRMLAVDEPHLQSGLALRPHQVDALAGMLAAVLGDFERSDQDEPETADDSAPRLADESTAVVGDSADDDDDAENDEFDDDNDDELPPIVDEPVARVALAGTDDDDDDDDDEESSESTDDSQSSCPATVALAEGAATAILLASPAQFHGTFSLNAALFAAVLLASRLESNEQVFGFVFLAIELFAFFPLARHLARRRSTTLHLQVALGLVVAATSALAAAPEHRPLLVMYLMAVMFVSLVCPVWLQHIHKYKFTIQGPWDVASVEGTGKLDP